MNQMYLIWIEQMHSTGRPTIFQTGLTLFIHPHVYALLVKILETHRNNDD
jgi:hypothetical protein